MTLRIGTCTLAAPRSVDLDIIEASDIGARLKRRQYRVEGVEKGSASSTVMTALAKSLRRYGAMYCEDTDSTIAPGYYRVQPGGGYEIPGGAPRIRDWNLLLTEQPWPSCVTRQAEDDNNLGTDTADSGMDEALYVAHTHSAGLATIQPRVVAGAEKFNLPAGRWRLVLRTMGSAAFKQQAYWRLTNLAGTVLSTGSNVNLPVSSLGMSDVALGVLTVPEANHLANWYEVYTVSVFGDSQAFTLDRVRVAPA